jgi:hypothetical protein
MVMWCMIHIGFLYDVNSLHVERNRFNDAYIGYIDIIDTTPN